jgi:hypothetical protein
VSTSHTPVQYLAFPLCNLGFKLQSGDRQRWFKRFSAFASPSICLPEQCRCLPHPFQLSSHGVTQLPSELRTESWLQPSEQMCVITRYAGETPRRVAGGLQHQSCRTLSDTVHRHCQGVLYCQMFHGTRVDVISPTSITKVRRFSWPP